VGEHNRVRSYTVNVAQPVGTAIDHHVKARHAIRASTYGGNDDDCARQCRHGCQET
jgi:hypothetical protein